MSPGVAEPASGVQRWGPAGGAGSSSNPPPGQAHEHSLRPLPRLGAPWTPSPNPSSMGFGGIWSEWKFLPGKLCPTGLVRRAKRLGLWVEKAGARGSRESPVLFPQHGQDHTSHLWRTLAPDSGVPTRGVRWRQAGSPEQQPGQTLPGSELPGSEPPESELQGQSCQDQNCWVRLSP